MKKYITMGLVAGALISLSACTTDNSGKQTTYRNNTGPQSAVPFPDTTTSSTVTTPIPPPAGSDNAPSAPAH
jgi:hypothetical protein